MNEMQTHVTELGVDDTTHLCNTPLDDIAKVLIIDIEVLSSLCSGSALLELVLPVAVAPSTISWT